MSEQYIVFSHGKDGEPWGAKIVAMAEVARRHGLDIESVDYRGIDDPYVRAQRLLEMCRSLPGQPVLVGSSLGGLISAVAAAEVPVRGMFLLAPAFYIAGYEEQTTPAPPRCPVTIVHGWNDDIVPAQNSITYASQYKVTLHLIDSDHRLNANVDEVCEFLDRFLRRLPV